MRLAEQLLLPSIDPIWNHGNNAELKKTREPGSLVPGDTLFLPEVEPTTYTLETGKRHRIVVRRPEAYLRARSCSAAARSAGLAWAGAGSSAVSPGGGL